MEESNEEPDVSPELYFLIAKFLSGGPLKETAKTMLKELERVEVLPRRLDWEGNLHVQSYEELWSRYSDVPWYRLVQVCASLLRGKAGPHRAITGGEEAGPRLHRSLLCDSLVRDPPRYTPWKQGHNLVKGLLFRAQGDAPPGKGMLSPRILSGLQLQRRTLAHLSAVYCLVIDKAGRFIVTEATKGMRLSICGLWKGYVITWILSGLQLQRRILAHLSAVYCLVIDKAGRFIVTGADDHLVKVWSADDGRLLASLRGAGGEITDLCCCEDWLAAGSVGRAVRVWAAGGEPRAVLAAHTGTVTSVHWSPVSYNGVRWLASTATDGSVAFWSCRNSVLTPRPVHFLERTRPGAAHMICAAWSAGGAFLATGSADHYVRVYHIGKDESPRRVCETAVHCDAVDSVSWSTRGIRFVSGSKDGRAALWNFSAAMWRPTLLHVTPLPQQDDRSDSPAVSRLKVTMVQWDCSDQFFITAVSDCSIRVWCARSVRQTRILRGHTAEAYVLERHPFLTGVFLSAGHDGRLIVWDAATGSTLYSYLNVNEVGEAAALFDAKWSWCGRWLAGTDAAGQLLRWGLGAGHPLYNLLPYEMFLHTDYRPLIRGANGGVVDEASGAPPHLLRDAVLVDADGAPHLPVLQRYAPVQPPVFSKDAAANRKVHLDSLALYESEIQEYSREMRRRPVMICTEPRLRLNRLKPRPAVRVNRTEQPDQPTSSDESDPTSSASDTSDVSVRLSDEMEHATDNSRSSRKYSSDSSRSSSSRCSDWGAGLPPPRRKRRPAKPARYSPGTGAGPSRRIPATTKEAEVPEAYRVGEWLTAVSPRKAPYFPQMGDECVYFRQGHERYFEAVSEKGVYKVNPRDKPWERTTIDEAMNVRVVGIKYTVRPPRLVNLKVQVSGGARRQFTVRYHDMPDVIDFLVLAQHVYQGRDFQEGERFRCLIDDGWWTGTVTSCSATSKAAAARAGHSGQNGHAGQAGPSTLDPAARFLSLRVRWDNGEVERMSPWDLEPLQPDRMPSEPGGSVAVLPEELAQLYCPDRSEWGGDSREVVCAAIVRHLDQVMSLSAAEPFLAPVDLTLYPSYALVVPYPVDLATIKARLENLFYRRLSAVQFDARHIASNAELFNRPGAKIIRLARCVSDLLLHIISNWRTVEVVSRYHTVAAAYRSSDDEAPPAPGDAPSSPEGRWRGRASKVLRALLDDDDSEPFRDPVDVEAAPDYLSVVPRPLHLRLIKSRMSGGRYRTPDSVAADIRRVLDNSARYNTNTRSRIYAMTRRLSARFEELWAKAFPERRTRRNGERKSSRRASSRNDTNNDHEHSNEHSDSIDSDEPLTVHKKGKGIGKKTRHNRVESESREEPEEEIEIDIADLGGEEEIVSAETLENGVSRSSSGCDMLLLPRHREQRSESRSSSWTRRKRRKRSSRGNLPKRFRERVSGVSCPSDASSSSEAVVSPNGRYESDKEYRPMYSTDDDAPLLTISSRQRQEEGADLVAERKKRKKPRLRRRPVLRYNEDSEEDAAAAISQRAASRQLPLTTRRPWASQSDHSYANGMQAGPSNPRSSPPPALSVSSRGRVRKPTAKVRELFAD